MFYKDDKRHDGMPAGTPSAQSDFSFADRVDRNQLMGDIKGSQGSAKKQGL